MTASFIYKVRKLSNYITEFYGAINSVLKNNVYLQYISSKVLLLGI